MANLTISVDDELLRRARVRAVGQGTSVNAILREELERYAGDGAGDRAADAFLRIARDSTASSGPGGRSWTRDELYAERSDRRG